MFFTYGEKETSRFFGSWDMREIAFDTTRRYLYYTSGDLPSTMLTNVQPSLTPSPTSTGPTGFPVAAPTEAEVAATTGIRDPRLVTWKRKIKVESIAISAKKHLYDTADESLCERDFFRLEITGAARAMAVGETPAPGPLLCESTGLDFASDRFCEANENFIRDPFYVRELYESLRDQFRDIRLEREHVALVSGRKDTSKYLTITSPHAKTLFASNSHVTLVFRMRSEYEFYRFWYVVCAVLGYDKLCVRPRRGLPPYDPRNDLIFSRLPIMYYHVFKKLDCAVFYTFVRGNVMGRKAAGKKVEPLISNAYLCITHDAVLVFRDTGKVPEWILIKQVHSFFFNDECAEPYAAFLSDDGPPDLIFSPVAPPYGEQAIKSFSASFEVRRLRHVLYGICFNSVEVRRVVRLEAVSEPSAAAFIDAYEAHAGRPLAFKPLPSCPMVAAQCPFPRDNLLEVWQEMRTRQAEQQRHQMEGQAAIPLYSNHMNNEGIHPEQFAALNRRLARERTAINDIVGMPYEEARSTVRPPMRRGNSTSEVANYAQEESRFTGLTRTNSVAVAELTLGVSRSRERIASESNLLPSPQYSPTFPRRSSNTMASPNSQVDDNSFSENTGALRNRSTQPDALDRDEHAANLAGVSNNFEFASSSDSDADENGGRERGGDDSDDDSDGGYGPGSRYYSKADIARDKTLDVIVENHSFLSSPE